MFSVTKISEEIFARIDGKSYKRDCPVSLESLRYLRVLHKNLADETCQGEMICNVEISARLLKIFSELYAANYPIEKIRLIDDYDADDELSMRDNNSSCFNFRRIAHTNEISTHGFGLAVDINPRYNPYIKFVDGRKFIAPATEFEDRSKNFPYKIEAGDLCCRLFAAHGFTWGGNCWLDRKDYQHFFIDARKIIM